MRTRLLAFGLSALSLLSFGCSSGAPLEVIDTAPEANQSNISVETDVRARLSQNVDPATLTTQSFSLTTPAGGTVAGTVRIGDEPDIIVFEASESLDTTTVYRGTITTALASTTGAILVENFQWSFTTLDPAWGVSELIDESGATGNSSLARVVADRNGNAFAVWERTDGGAVNLWASRYTRRDLWGPPEQIENNDGDAVNAQVAVDPGGNAIVVWEQAAANGDVNIWANRYADGQGWGTAELIQTGEVTTARSPSIAIDPDGNAITIWVQDVLTGPTGNVVWSNRYTRNQGWGEAERIESQMPTLLGIITSIAIDSNGDAVAVWRRQRNPGDDLLANTFTEDDGWGIEQQISPEDGNDLEGQRVTSDPDGNVFVVWQQEDEGSTQLSVWSNRYDESTGMWDGATTIETHETGDATEPDVGVGPSGVAHAVWSQQDAVFLNIWASQYTPGSGWGEPELIEEAFADPDDDDDASKPRIAVNFANEAFAVWEQGWLGWLSIWSNRFVPDTGWVMGNAELIEQIELAGRSPGVTVDQLGHAHVVWLHTNDNGRGEIRTNRFE